MFEKILVPLDGSAAAEAVLPYAVELTRRLGSQITLVSVLPSGSQQGKAQYQHLHQFYIQELFKPAEYKRPEISSVILSGDPAQEISDYAARKGFGLILMGTRDRSAIKRWVLGSVADKVVATTNLPVALVTASDEEKKKRGGNIFRRSVVVLDGFPESEVVIPFAEELAAGLKMEVVLLQVINQAYEFFEGAEDYSSVPLSGREMGALKAKARRYLKKIAGGFQVKGIKSETHLVTGEPAEAIIRVAGEVGADVLFLATKGRSGLSRWMFSGIRDDIVSIGNTLVFLVRIPN